MNYCVLCALVSGAAAVLAQTPAATIQDNSFLLEEAYNQEAGVVQHISSFTRMWNSRDWTYSFTQEWPGLSNPRNQYSYTVSGMHAGAFAGSGSGPGDVMLNYRYQVLGSGASRVAFAPRVSLMLPTGRWQDGRGSGGSGVQAGLPFSIVLHPRVITHWNVAGTFVRQARSVQGDRANSAGYSLGQSFVFVVHPRVHAMVETISSQYQAVTGPGRTEWTRQLYVSPGIRWAYNFASGLQVVPGVAMPIGVGSSAGETGLLVYLSFEAPLKSIYGR